MRPSVTDSRVAIVSGKGGVGKTTVTAALGMAAARAGRRTLLVEVEQRNAIAPLFGAPPLSYEERTLAPNLGALSVDPDDALVEYLYLFYGIKRIGKVLARSKVVDFATNTAPGLRDILLIGKVKEAERRRADGAYRYDLVVLDAPPTGRLPRFLDAPRAIVDLVAAGPIRSQAQGVLDMIADHRRCRVVLVTLAEDMPVRETIEAAEALAKMGIAVGPVVVNGIWPEPPPMGDDPAAAIAEAASTLPPQAAEALAAVAATHSRRVANQRDAVATLERELPIPQIRLPFLFTPRVARAEVERLSHAIEEAGALT